MEKNRTTTFSVYLTITLFLISTFITMVITESNIIKAPLFPCPNGYIRDYKGDCREIIEG
uniref:U17-MYRTX-Tb1e n=1 Tax=Tetramorium bicarinatum TaxID=219812 RepID=A0A6M6RP72_TETBN|nr:U17-MYRTX-Tb1e precursor [Tetramorium bicarinatum]